MDMHTADCSEEKFPPVSPQTSNPMHPRHQRFYESLLALGGLIIFAICVIAYFGYHLYEKNAAAGVVIIPSGTTMFIVANDEYTQPLSRVDTATGVTVPFTVVGQGNALLIDAVLDGTSTPYYLIEAPDLKTSNVFTGNVQNPKVGLAEITNTPSIKHELSVDPASGMVAYVQEASSSPHVVVYSQTTKKETDLGLGTNPTLMPGGFFVIVRHGDEIVSINTQTGTVYPLAEVATTSPFAIDPAKGVLALYNAQTKTIQYFSITSQVASSYTSSSAILNSEPASLAFVNHSLLASYNSFSGKSTTLLSQIMLQFVDAKASEVVHYSQTSPELLVGYRLSPQQ
jgi:hypothetical protein